MARVDYPKQLSPELTPFRILREHYPQLMEVMKFQITSRREFDRLAKIEPNTLTDLQRAARFLYMQKTSFGGKVSGQNFGVSKDTLVGTNFSNLFSFMGLSI